MQGLDFTDRFPVTHESDWCGEHEDRETVDLGVPYRAVDNIVEPVSEPWEWTSVVPKEEGWYWRRHDGDAAIVYLSESVLRHCGVAFMKECLEYCGPIPEPEGK